VGASVDAVYAVVLVVGASADGAVYALADAIGAVVRAEDAIGASADDAVLVDVSDYAFDGDLYGALGRLGGGHVQNGLLLFVGDESGAFAEGPCLRDAYLSRRAPRTLVRQALEPTFWNLTLSSQCPPLTVSASLPVKPPNWW